MSCALNLLSVPLKVVFTINTYLYKTRLAPSGGTTSSNVPFTYNISISSAITICYYYICFRSLTASLYIREIRILVITSAGKAALDIILRLLLY